MIHDDDFREQDGIAETIDAMLDTLFDEWCKTCQRFHQSRDHPIKCSLCNRQTFRVHGICETHQIVTPNE